MTGAVGPGQGWGGEGQASEVRVLAGGLHRWSLNGLLPWGAACSCSIQACCLSGMRSLLFVYAFGSDDYLISNELCTFKGRRRFSWFSHAFGLLEKWSKLCSLCVTKKNRREQKWTHWPLDSRHRWSSKVRNRATWGLACVSFFANQIPRLSPPGDHRHIWAHSTSGALGGGWGHITVRDCQPWPRVGTWESFLEYRVQSSFLLGAISISKRQDWEYASSARVLAALGSWSLVTLSTPCCGHSKQSGNSKDHVI